MACYIIQKCLHPISKGQMREEDFTQFYTRVGINYMKLVETILQNRISDKNLDRLLYIANEGSEFTCMSIDFEQSLKLSKGKMPNFIVDYKLLLLLCKIYYL